MTDNLKKANEILEELNGSKGLEEYNKRKKRSFAFQAVQCGDGLFYILYVTGFRYSNSGHADSDGVRREAKALNEYFNPLPKPTHFGNRKF